MNEFFKELVERAQYYSKFEFFREERQKSSDEIEQEWAYPERKK